MKKIIKLKLGASLLTITFSMLGGINQANAQTCTTPPSCATLGYDKSAIDCTGQPSLKCPFDQSQMFCAGAGEEGGGSCDNPNIGTIIYSDKTCSGRVLADKTAIAVVFNPTYRLAIGLETGRKNWSMESFDVPSLTNYGREDFARQDWEGRANTNKVLNYCRANSKSCPAFEYVNGYTTAGTTAGDWYLPSLGELNDIYLNRATLNRSLSLVGGAQLTTDFWHGSSSEYNTEGAWIKKFSDGFDSANNNKNIDFYVRPVLAF